jgi:mRNA interferase MazF
VGRNVPLEAGDLYWAELDGYQGTEQGGRRPVLIVSERFYNDRSNRVIVCPVSTRERGWKTEVKLAEDLPVKGVVLTDQIRALDRQLRLFSFIARLSDENLAEVKNVLGLILGLQNIHDL